jgi:hypothetical protein
MSTAMDRNAFTTGVLAVLAQRQRSLDARLTKLSNEGGPAAPVGPAPAHRWRGTKLAFEKPDGKWGQEVDLRGPAGGVSIVRASGSDVPAAPERIQRTDYADTRFAYVGFASRVVRIDYGVHPPLREVAPSGDWDARHALPYGPG